MSEELLEETINFARSIIEIEDIIKHARKFLLFFGGNAWVKNEGNYLLDVTLGSYNRTRVCVLLELYFISKFALLVGTKNIEL